jgi:hypothetical protein
MSNQEERTYFRMNHINLDLFRYLINSNQNSANSNQDLTLEVILDKAITPSTLAERLAEDLRAVRVVLYLYTISNPYEQAFLNEIERKIGVAAVTLSCLLNKSMQQMGVVSAHKGVEDFRKHQGKVWLKLNPSLDELFPLEVIKAWDTRLKEMILLYLPTYYINKDQFLALKQIRQLTEYADIDEEQVKQFLLKSPYVAYDGDNIAKNYVEIYKGGKMIKISITPRYPTRDEVNKIKEEQEEMLRLLH